MGMTMTQKILAAHAGLDSVQAGQLIEADLDLVLANDITGPVAIHEVEKLKREQYGFLELGNLKSGEYRPLTIKEVHRLYAYKK